MDHLKLLQLFQLPLVSNPDATAPVGAHIFQLHGGNCSFGSCTSLPISHPDPTPDDHYCFDVKCPKCNPKTGTLQTPSAAYLSVRTYFMEMCNSGAGSTLQKSGTYFLESAILAPISHPDKDHV
ncbi:hypothetical protein M758_10G051500 [Ceratodon purpureus]|nr:hypothetical protein M758_10G051500 [Ceratodon purpureus]